MFERNRRPAIEVLGNHDHAADPFRQDVQMAGSFCSMVFCLLSDIGALGEHGKWSRQGLIGSVFLSRHGGRLFSLRLALVHRRPQLTPERRGLRGEAEVARPLSPFTCSIGPQIHSQRFAVSTEFSCGGDVLSHVTVCPQSSTCFHEALHIAHRIICHLNFRLSQRTSRARTCRRDS